MAKYSKDLKLIIVRDYQNGHLSIRSLAKKYGISKLEVGRWIQLYPKFGADCLRFTNFKRIRFTRSAFANS